MTTDVLRILNEIPGSNLRYIQQAQEEYVKAAKNEILRYPKQTDLYQAGLYDQYQNIYRDSVMIDTYKKVVETVTLRLNQEQNALTQIKQVIVDINEASANNNYVGAPTLATLAEDGLLRIKNILNSVINNGQFLFGGVNSTTPPCGDLVRISNIVNGNITTNYTQSSPNLQTVKISDLPIFLNYGIYAGMPAVAQAIGYLNNLKTNNLNNADIAYNNANLLYKEAIAKICFQRDKINTANEYNSNLTNQNILTISKIFQRDTFEIATDLRISIEALRFAYRIAALQNQTSNELFQIF